MSHDFWIFQSLETRIYGFYFTKNTSKTFGNIWGHLGQYYFWKYENKKNEKSDHMRTQLSDLLKSGNLEILKF